MLRESGLTAMDIFENVDENYGVMDDGLMPEEDEEAVMVPQSALELFWYVSLSKHYHLSVHK